MVAGVMRSEAAPELIDSAGVALDPSLLSIDYLNGEPISAVHDAPPPVGPSGAAAAYRRDAFAAAGGFDERIFAYWEDVDLALRLRSAGGRCALAPDALGTHRHAGTLGSGSPRKNYLMGFGRGYLLRKWGVLRTRHAPAALLRDLATWAGQAALDRNLGGFRGWIGGIRAARGSLGYPRWLAAEPSLAVTGSPLRRRLARRLRMRGAR
jgi:GT2 family glycosyltransferase